jgi:tRNA pseudouridine(38-40) synthase
MDDQSVRWRLKVAYDGSGFHGFAAQQGQSTVAEALSGALGRVTRSAVTLTCAGRTDAGVHALGQVVHFDLPRELSDGLDAVSVVKSCNSQLGPAIVVREAEIAPAGFDARHSALARRYRYLVVNGPVADPLLAGLTWHVAAPLDLRSMAAASDALLGEHDFRAFCRRVPGTAADDPINRRVIDTRWTCLSHAPEPTDPGPTASVPTDPGPTASVPTAPVPSGHGPTGHWPSGHEPSGHEPSGQEPSGQGASGPALPPWTPPALTPAVGSLLAFEIEANAFCHQMVRSLVGTLVDIGRGKKRPSDMVWILRSADRQQASQPAPPQGLTLMAVRYGG